MSDLRILYIANEIDPFLDLTKTSDKSAYISKLVRYLAKNARGKDAEVRVVVPKFGTVSDRKFKLHEVVRLSGININVGEELKLSIIKVASIREERVQVYFIDNDEYFKRKSIFKDKNGNFHKDNNERLIFFSKGILETIKQLEWFPNVIHCHEWFSALVPMYIKTLYKDEPAFKNAKSIFTYYNNTFPQGLLNPDILKIEPQLKEENLVNAEQINYENMINLGAKYADIVTQSNIGENSENKYPITTELSKKTKIISTNSIENFVASYEGIYNQLILPMEEVS